MGGGLFMSKAQAEARVKAGESLRLGVSADQRSESDIKISEALEKIGNEVGANVTSVALAWISRYNSAIR
jgi:aryl-alcohol dehydrogenase-like predicted oxidoreductase